MQRGKVATCIHRKHGSGAVCSASARGSVQGTVRALDHAAIGIHSVGLVKAMQRGQLAAGRNSEHGAASIVTSRVTAGVRRSVDISVAPLNQTADRKFAVRTV